MYASSPVDTTLTILQSSLVNTTSVTLSSAGLAAVARPGCRLLCSEADAFSCSQHFVCGPRATTTCGACEGTVEDATARLTLLTEQEALQCALCDKETTLRHLSKAWATPSPIATPMHAASLVDTSSAGLVVVARVGCRPLQRG